MPDDADTVLVTLPSRQHLRDVISSLDVDLEVLRSENGNDELTARIEQSKEQFVAVEGAHRDRHFDDSHDDSHDDEEEEEEEEVSEKIGSGGGADPLVRLQEAKKQVNLATVDIPTRYASPAASIVVDIEQLRTDIQTHEGLTGGNDDE
jgi:TATA-binding protein-associated factor Taf7